MLDIGWSELLLIGVVALIVVGPKDLPVMFHTLGRITARARQMAREFSRAMEDAAKETGLDAADLKGMASKKSLGLDALERATEKFEKWDPKFPSPSRTAPQAPLQPDPGLDAAEESFEPDDEPAPVAPEPAPVAEAPKPRKPRAPKAEAEAKPAKAETAPKPRKKAAKKDEA
ncbi:Sec-independent protein translocase protein TatB [Paenirhodobacter sp.]|uniref:Sec-independent protein translocase protein TatB n=1 Tax=Paenirhodobacter sp. TaxID=1965326 RepID=UPI003B3E86AB